MWRGGSALRSIPQLMRQEHIEIEDDAVGAITGHIKCAVSLKLGVHSAEDGRRERIVRTAVHYAVD